MSAPSRNISYVKQDEPSFLKAFKAKVGYREPDTVETKREIPQAPPGEDRDSGEEREDEQPTVVVLREGDVSEEAYQQLRRKRKEDEKGEKPNDSQEGEGEKILFKKPVKRRKSSEGEGGVLDASTKRPKQEKTKRRTSTSKSVKNSSLLSFGDDEEENG